MQKTAYEIRISDWSSDVCSSDLVLLIWLKGALRSPPIAIRTRPHAPAPSARPARAFGGYRPGVPRFSIAPSFQELAPPATPERFMGLLKRENGEIYRDST